MNTIVVTGIRQLPDGSYPIGTMAAFGKTLWVSSIILNRFALGLSVIYSDNEDGSPGQPYQPLQFPAGTWKITALMPSSDPELSPVFIKTDSHQLVPVWSVTNGQNKGSKYLAPTGDYIMDYFDGIHFDSLYKTTDGCLRLYSAEDALWLSGEIDALKAAGETVQISVE